MFTEADLCARKYVRDLCLDAQLEIIRMPWATRSRAGKAANRRSRQSALARISMPFPNAGRFDGTVGVLGGLEAIRALQRSGFTPQRSIELIVFTSEEPTRFGIGCLGSRMMSGVLAASAVDSLDAVRLAAGFEGGLNSVRRANGLYSAFIELHIEQGPVLEREGIDLGIVTAIAAPATLRIQLDGEGGHAGAVLMPARRDAFLAAAEIALAVESAAKSTGAPDTVGTSRHLRHLPARREQHPQPREHGDRCARH